MAKERERERGLAMATLRILSALLIAAAIDCVGGFSSARAAGAPLVHARGRAAPALARRTTPQPRCTAPAKANTVDLVGDGGVIKTVLAAGAGARPTRGAMVEVHYVGLLVETGAVFDSSRARGKTFKFSLGEGKVIGGWEVGVSSMQVGELSEITCSPQYAYGVKGIPPMIPPSATLRFEVELLAIEQVDEEGRSFADDYVDTARTPGAISAAYKSKMAAKPTKAEGLEGLLDWAKSIYIFGLFSPTAERPPWYLNPLITFPSIFAIVGVGFYLVVLLGGVHRGEVPQAGDDLSSFIGDTMAP